MLSPLFLHTRINNYKEVGMKIAVLVLVGILVVLSLIVNLKKFNKAERQSEKNLYLANMLCTLVLALSGLVGYRSFNAQNADTVAIGLGTVLALCAGIVAWHLDAVHFDKHAVRFGATSLIDYYVTSGGVLVAIQKAPNYHYPEGAKYKILVVGGDYLKCRHIDLPFETLAAAQQAITSGFGHCKRLPNLGYFELWIQHTQYGDLVSTEKQFMQARKILAKDVPSGAMVTPGAQAFLESYLGKSEMYRYPAFIG